MTTHLVTFSADNMLRSRELCVSSAKVNGVSIAHEYDPRDTDHLIRQHGIDPDARGCGYWAWKPAIILETMNRIGRIDTAFSLPGNNVIVYADAGIELINNANYIIDRMDQDIFLFGNNWEHAYWCKRDVVDEVWELPAYDDAYLDYSPLHKSALIRDEDGGLSWDNFGKQVQASVIFFRVSDYSRKFVKEWLDWCLFEGGRLIDDSPSLAPNHPEFREHRHDQAILTTMAYREGLRLHYWPAVYNKDGAPEFVYEKLPEHASDDYPILFSHHRKRNNEWR